MFDWDVAQPGGGSRPPSALPVLLAATAELPSPLRASTALYKAPQAPKAAPVSHLRIPGGHLEQEHPSTALQARIPSPQHRNTSVWLWKLKMQSGVTCKLDSSLAPAMLGKHRGHPALPVAALLLPHGRAGAQGCLVSRVWFAQAGQAGAAVTPPPGHPCLFGFFTTFHQNKHQTRAPERVRSKAEECMTGDTGQCQMSPSSGEFPAPDPGYPRPGSSWAVWDLLPNSHLSLKELYLLLLSVAARSR